MQPFHKLAIVLALAILTGSRVYADGTHPQGIKLDGTLGTAGKLNLPGPNYDIKAEFGKQTGANLFHSFEQFNLHFGESATFSGADSVRNIVSRVTGGQASWIDGRLVSTIPGADLYFMNPSGLMFGPNASLDLSGSFHISTADYLKTEDNEQFYALPQTNEILSAASPESFGFLNDNPAKISVEGSYLKVSEEKNMSFTGGDVDLRNSTLEIPGNMTVRASAFAADNTRIFGSLSGVKDIGAVMIDADTVVFDKSHFFRGSSGTGKAGDIIFEAKESVSCSGTSVSTLAMGDSPDAGAAGDFQIKAADISFNGTTVETSTSGAGQAGDIVFEADRNISLSKAYMSSGTSGQGSGGDISFTAQNISFTDATYISTSTFSSADAGNVNIAASGTVSIAGSGTGIFTFTSSTEDTAGKGGNISVSAQTLSLSDKGKIIAYSIGQGAAGNIRLNVGRLETDTESSIASDSPFPNAYTGFATVQERDDNIPVNGDRLEIKDTGTGKGTVSVHVGNTQIPLRIYSVSNISELEELAQKYFIIPGSVAQVSDAGDGTPGRFVHTDPSTGQWMRFYDDRLHILPDKAASDSITYQFYDNVSTFPPYASGDVIRVNDMGDGKAGLFVYSLTENDWGSFSTVVRLGCFDVGDMAELSQLNYAFTDWDILRVKNDNSSFVFWKSEWIKLTDKIRSVEDIEAVKQLIFVRAGNIVKVEDGGDGNPATFMYSGKEWVTLNNSVHAVADLAERDNLSAQTGDIAYTAEDGTGKSGYFLYKDGEWIKFVKNDSGNINIIADTVGMKNKSRISSSSQGNGDASDITLAVRHFEADSGSTITSESKSEYLGGDAGTITIRSDDSLGLSGGSSLTVSGTDSGGGKISIRARNSLYLSDSEITSNVTQGIGNGGDVSADSEFLILNQGRITANAQEGDGGAIFIRAENFIRSSDSKITAASQRGNEGTVTIQAPDLDIAAGLTVMPGNFLDAAKWALTPCSQRSAENLSRFLFQGLDALPLSFEDWQPSPVIKSDDAGACRTHAPAAD